MIGSTAPFGQSPSSCFGSPSMFGQASNPDTNPFGSPSPFGLQTESSIFGTSTSVFAQPSGAPAFNASSSPAFGAASNPNFGATPTPAFGSSSTSAYGSTPTPLFGTTGTAFGVTVAPAFGSTAAPAFGSQSTSLFGSSITPAFGSSTTPAFGSNIFTTSTGFGGSLFSTSASISSMSNHVSFGPAILSLSAHFQPSTTDKANGAGIEALMPKLCHADYYTEPQIQELAAKERAEPGFCRQVKDFVVGRCGFGSIKFLGETDVRGIDLESILEFNNREVIMYKEGSKKPHIGQGLNKPAEVTLLNVKYINKNTGVQYTKGAKVEMYKKYLIKKAREQQAEFVSYDAVNGEWKFRVKHFSSYEFQDGDSHVFFL